MNGLLNKIDGYFAKKSRFETTLYFTIIFLFIVFLAYEYLVPLSEKKLKQEKMAKESIERLLAIDKGYIASISKNGNDHYMINRLLKEKSDKKNYLARLIDEKTYLNVKLKELSPLLYNKKKWAKFLDSITAKANRFHIDIKSIANEFITNKQEFGHVLEVDVKAKGAFHDILAFLNSLEESDLVVDIYQISMHGKFPIQLQFKVSVWGINY